MVIFSLCSWWYSTGWLTLMQKCAAWLSGTLKFFSVGELLGSLFAPFRQISAGRVDGPLAVKLRALGDNIFSRIIGAIVRLLLVFIGLLTLIAVGVLSVIFLVAWPFIPIAPFVGLLFAGKGV